MGGVVQNLKGLVFGLKCPDSVIAGGRKAAKRTLAGNSFASIKTSGRPHLKSSRDTQAGGRRGDGMPGDGANFAWPNLSALVGIENFGSFEGAFVQMSGMLWAKAIQESIGLILGQIDIAGLRAHRDRFVFKTTECRPRVSDDRGRSGIALIAQPVAGLLARDPRSPRRRSSSAVLRGASKDRVDVFQLAGWIKA